MRHVKRVAIFKGFTAWWGSNCREDAGIDGQMGRAIGRAWRRDDHFCLSLHRGRQWSSRSSHILSHGNRKIPKFMQDIFSTLLPKLGSHPFKFPLL